MSRRLEKVFGSIAAPLLKTWRYLSAGSWQRAAAWLAALACVFAAGGFLFAWLGLVPVAASAGHWRITVLLLEFAMRNSVETYSAGVRAPPLDDSALVLKAAGHYATGCAPCHGAPGENRSPVVDQMTPEPPLLPPKLTHWTPPQLFWIVKHGIKYTAMPGWTALEREDEVWAMVAFLLRLPELTPVEYRQLAYGERTAGGLESDAVGYIVRPLGEPIQVILADCARCHGRDGAGRGLGAFPKLAGQNEEYLLASLLAYARGTRHSGIMEPVAASLSEQTLRVLAAYYAGLPPSAAGGHSGAAGASIERGRLIAELGIPEQGVPSCADCHGPRPWSHNPVYPRLAGQYAAYLALQLELFKSGRRGGTPYTHIMNNVAGRLTQAQMLDVTAYYASIAGAANSAGKTGALKHR